MGKPKGLGANAPQDAEVVTSAPFEAAEGAAWNELEKTFGLDVICEDDIPGQVLINKELAGDLDVTVQEDVDILDDLSASQMHSVREETDDDGVIIKRTFFIGYLRLPKKKGTIASKLTRLGEKYVKQAPVRRRLLGTV